MKKTAKFSVILSLVLAMVFLSSCSMLAKGDAADGLDGGYGGDYGSGGYGGGYSGGYVGGGYVENGALMPDSDAALDSSSPESTPDDTEIKPKPEVDNVRLPGGMITAAAWNDNDNYSSWLELFSDSGNNEKECGKFYSFRDPAFSWGFNSLNRIKVFVNDGGNPIKGAKVTASNDEGQILFSAVTDAQGNAYLFTKAASGNITVTSGENSTETAFSEENRSLSVELPSGAEKLDVIEIMLLVDVTGSMGDEINFLKAELADVINRIAQNNSNTKIKLAMLFYRDLEDSVPFEYYDFVEVTSGEGLKLQQAALDKQYATGGGDYPEAVDEALELAVNKQWSSGSTTKIIFQVLDAPAHEGDKYAQRLVNATKTAAEKGIRICPIICSGAAVETEYTMREAAIYTGGTFVFVTDDSGIGNSHHDPDLPNATVELLNSLMVRLVNGYHTGDFDAPVYWKEDPNLTKQ